jgi:hypothetical protein
MNDSDFETLMAYADGELSAAQAQAVEARLAVDAEARDLVERLRQTRAELAVEMDALLDEPVPQHLIDTVRQHPMGRTASAEAEPPPALAPAQPLTAEGAPRSAANSPSYWPRMATAACLALAVGLTTGHWWGQQSGTRTDLAQTLQRALQTLPSGETLAQGGAQVMPVASFRAANGQACREFEQEAQGRVAHGLACLDGDQWVARVVLDRGPANGALGEAPAFAPASGEADALATLLDRLGASAVLDAAEEQALIQQGWSPAR